MSRYGQKFQLFIFGLSVGLLVGCLFFIFKLDDFFGKVSLFEKERKATVTEELVTNETSDKTEKKEKGKSKSQTFTSKTDNKESQGDAGSSTSGAYTYSSSDEENISVLKEEMVSVKNINVREIGGGSDYKGISDSVLSSLSGISPAKKTDFFMVEFWKTPLNSKGYKMTRNRVLIYGLKEKEDLTMVKMGDTYYLKNNSEVYRLNYSPDFRQMEKVNEADIIQKLNI